MAENYVDPNSGAAPQPGGFAGVEAAEKGFAIPVGAELENEVSPSEYEQPGGNPEPKSVEELAALAGGPAPVVEEPVEEPAVEGEVSEGNSRAPKSPEPEAYDPGEHNVDDVNDYLEANPDQRDAVLKAERKGKNRKGITGDE